MDFSRLKTPPNHGDTLVEPVAGRLAALAALNHEQLDVTGFRILDVSGSDVRREVRRSLGLPDETLAIVTGHRSEFIHPGVWAKHVVADRLAEAVSGTAVNLVVDSDAMRDTTLHVPTTAAGQLTVTAVPAADAPPGFALERVERMCADRLVRFERTLRSLLGERLERSMMPVYLKRLGDDDSGRDWVDQTTSARRAVENRLGVRVDDVRVGRAWGVPLLAEMIARAAEFAGGYNRALAEYRRCYRVRSAQRPIPDLLVESDRVEVPAWVYRRGEPRRRLFVSARADVIEVFADRERLGAVERSRLLHRTTTSEALAALEGVMFRPRALTLTLWARLFVADLFIHGIGGAKYDRITDALIRDYFGVAPPAMACVSATMHLDLPHHDVTANRLREARHRLRDLRYNPQRYVAVDGETATSLRQRAEAIALSRSLRNDHPAEHVRRRLAFETIRELSDRVLAIHPQVTGRLAREVREMERHVWENAIAGRRDCFFALFSREALEMLLARLPGVGDFRL